VKRLLVAAALVAALVAPAVAGACAKPRASLFALEGQVMCPVCHTTLDQSDSPTAAAIKRFISRRIAACETAGQIKRELVDSFGEAILAAPPKKGFDLLAWWLPLGGIILGATAIGGGVWRWSRTRDAERVDGQGGAPERLDPELERRVDEALARFEG
jgi:cytochrome c-type biogenesis protein CcmH